MQKCLSPKKAKQKLHSNPFPSKIGDFPSPRAKESYSTHEAPPWAQCQALLQPSLPREGRRIIEYLRVLEEEEEEGSSSSSSSPGQRGKALPSSSLPRKSQRGRKEGGGCQHIIVSHKQGGIHLHTVNKSFWEYCLPKMLTFNV